MAYPDVEIEVLICDGFDVEAYRGDCGYDFADLEAVEQGRFAGVVEAEDQDTDFLFGPEEVGEEREGSAHFSEALGGALSNGDKRDLLCRRR